MARGSCLANKGRCSGVPRAAPFTEGLTPMTELLEAALQSAFRARYRLQQEADEILRENAQLKRRIRELERVIDGYKRL